MIDEQHLDVDLLADLLAGEGADAEIEHVSRCAACASALDELDGAQAEVAAALAALPAPPVPVGLAERLSAALAGARPLPAVEADGPRPTTGLPPLAESPDEPPDRHPDREPASGGATRTVTPLPRGTRPARAWLPAAAVVVLALSAVGLGVSALPDAGDDAATSAGGGAEDTAASAPEQSIPSAGLVVNDTGRDYAASPSALADALPGLLAGSAAPAAPVPRPADPGAAESPEASAGLGADEPAPASAGALDRLRDPVALQACLRALEPAGDAAPLAVDYAAYAGQAALAVVLPADDPAQVDVFVVGAGCAPGNDSTLLFTRLDRPS